MLTGSLVAIATPMGKGGALDLPALGKLIDLHIAERHRRHRRRRHHRRIADRRFRRALRADQGGGRACARAHSRSSPGPAPTPRPRRSRSRPTRRRPGRDSAPVRRAVLQQADAGRPVPALPRDRRDGRPAADPLQRAGPHGRRSRQRYGAAPGRRFRASSASRTPPRTSAAAASSSRRWLRRQARLRRLQRRRHHGDCRCMLMGGHGVISVTANVAPKLMAEMCEAALAGDIAAARDLQRPPAAAAPEAVRRGESDPVKWALAQMGLIENELRLPLVPLSPQYHDSGPRRVARSGLRMTTLKVPGMLHANSGRRCARSPPSPSASRSRAASRSTSSLTKRIDYKSESRAPALELPPDLAAPQYDDRYTVDDRVGSRGAGRESPARPPRRIAVNATPEARIVRGGTERWLVVKATPAGRLEHAAQVLDRHRLRAGGRAADARHHGDRLGGEPRRHAERFPAATRSARSPTSSSPRTSATSSARASKRAPSRARSTSTLSHRGAEQVPTTYDRQHVARRRFVWAVTPPEPGPRSRNAGARDGALRNARAGRGGGGAGRDRRHRARPRAPREGGRAAPTSSSSTTASTARGAASASRSTASASPWSTATGRKGTYFVRYADPDTDGAKKEKGFLDKLSSGRPTSRRPSSTGSPWRMRPRAAS